MLLKRQIHGETVLFWINYCLFQYLFIRLFRNSYWTKFGIVYFIYPHSGWEMLNGMNLKKLYLYDVNKGFICRRTEL